MNIKESVIQIKHLDAGYGGKAILKDVNFDVYAGEVLVILGGSGCGKTTVLRHIIGLQPPIAGDILILGDNLFNTRGATRQNILKRIGVAFQSGALFGSMTLLENVRLPLDEYTRLSMDVKNRIASIKLKQVELEGFDHFLPAELSGGMQKRAALARAMALDPKILLLDEPGAGLDPVTAAGLDELILRLAKDLGITFVIVTHELASVFKVADRVVMLDKKQQGIIAIGSPDELKEQKDNEAVWKFFNRKPA